MRPENSFTGGLMKKVLIYSAVAALLFVMTVTGCDKVEPETACDENVNNYCQLPDGNWGIYECINGEFGDCIPQPPINAPPCAYMIETELTYEMIIVAECADREFIECQIEPFLYQNTLFEGIYCEKIFDNGDVFSWFFPFVEPEKYDCFLLNILCCNSNARDCLVDE